MATFKPPFAYNTGGPISGTTQYGDFVVGDVEVDYSSDYGGVKWWASPEDITGYVIGNARPGGQPVPSGATGTANVGFWRSKGKTSQAFLDLANYIGAKNGQPPFATTTDAETWLNSNGYYSSYGTVTPTPTPTIELTPTPTITPSRTPTRTPTPTITPTNTPYPPNTYFFYLPDGGQPFAPTNNGQLMFTDDVSVIYNPNSAIEVVVYLTDKSGLYHSEYLDATIYGGSVTMTQFSNTVILNSGDGLWSDYGTYISGNYMDVVQPSPNPFVSGSPINLVITVNYPTTPTPTPTNTETPTPTPTVTPTEPHFLLFEDSSIATAENNDEIEIEY